MRRALLLIAVAVPIVGGLVYVAVVPNGPAALVLEPPSGSRPAGLPSSEVRAVNQVKGPANLSVPPTNEVVQPVPERPGGTEVSSAHLSPHTLRGWVIDARGVPVTAAHIVAEWGDQARMETRAGTSDPNGCFDIDGVPGAPLHVTVRAAPHPPWEGTLTPGEEGEERKIIRLRRVSKWLVTLAGEGVADSRRLLEFVKYSEEHFGETSDGPPETVLPESEGPVGEGRIRVVVELDQADRQGPRRLARLGVLLADGRLAWTGECDLATEGGERALHYDHGTEISGYVRDATGSVISGVWVRHGPVSEERYTTDEAVLLPTMGWKGVRTDAEGRFMLRISGEGPYVLRATGKGYGDHVGPVVAPSLGPREDIEIVMNRTPGTPGR